MIQNKPTVNDSSVREGRSHFELLSLLKSSILENKFINDDDEIEPLLKEFIIVEGQVSEDQKLRRHAFFLVLNELMHDIGETKQGSYRTNKKVKPEELKFEEIELLYSKLINKIDVRALEASSANDKKAKKKKKNKTNNAKSVMNFVKDETIEGMIKFLAEQKDLQLEHFRMHRILLILMSSSLEKSLLIFKKGLREHYFEKKLFPLAKEEIPSDKIEPKNMFARYFLSECVFVVTKVYSELVNEEYSKYRQDKEKYKEDRKKAHEDEQKEIDIERNKLSIISEEDGFSDADLFTIQEEKERREKLLNEREEELEEKRRNEQTDGDFSVENSDNLILVMKEVLCVEVFKPLIEIGISSQKHCQNFSKYDSMNVYARALLTASISMTFFSLIEYIYTSKSDNMYIRHCISLAKINIYELIYNSILPKEKSLLLFTSSEKDQRLFDSAVLKEICVSAIQLLDILTNISSTCKEAYEKKVLDKSIDALYLFSKTNESDEKFEIVDPSVLGRLCLILSKCFLKSKKLAKIYHDKYSNKETGENQVLFVLGKILQQKFDSSLDKKFRNASPDITKAFVNMEFAAYSALCSLLSVSNAKVILNLDRKISIVDTIIHHIKLVEKTDFFKIEPEESKLRPLDELKWNKKYSGMITLKNICDIIRRDVSQNDNSLFGGKSLIDKDTAASIFRKIVSSEILNNIVDTLEDTNESFGKKREEMKKKKSNKKSKKQSKEETEDDGNDITKDERTYFRYVAPSLTSTFTSIVSTVKKTNDPESIGLIQETIKKNEISNSLFRLSEAVDSTKVESTTDVKKVIILIVVLVLFLISMPLLVYLKNYMKGAK